jgi:hypothetical protein
MTLREAIDRFEADRRPVRIRRAVVMSPADWRYSVRNKGTMAQAAVRRLALLGDRSGLIVGVVAETVEGTC